LKVNYKFFYFTLQQKKQKKRGKHHCMPVITVASVGGKTIYRSRYGRQPSASRKRPALQGLPHPASGIFTWLEYNEDFDDKILILMEQ